MDTSKLLILGIVIIFVGITIMALGSAQGPSSTGIVIFIGPIPIIFGSGPQSGELILIGLVICIAMVVMSLLWLLSWRRLSREIETT